MRLGTVRFAGIAVNPVTQWELLEFFRRAVHKTTPTVVGAHNLHSAYLIQHDEQMRTFYEQCNLAYVDGMSLVWTAQALDLPLRAEHRVPFLDWYDDFFRMALKRQWRIFYLGGEPGVTDWFRQTLERKYPGIQAQFHHGYVRQLPVEELCQTINAFHPNVLMVGMGMPVQERWIARALPHLKVNLIYAGGAMMEYLAGKSSAAPRWMGRLGVEWFYRLVHEPRRLARRYLMEPFTLVPILAREWYVRQHRTREFYVTNPEAIFGFKGDK